MSFSQKGKKQNPCEEEASHWQAYYSASNQYTINKPSQMKTKQNKLAEAAMRRSNMLINSPDAAPDHRSEGPKPPSGGRQK
jgi:hypothetical protein